MTHIPKTVPETPDKQALTLLRERRDELIREWWGKRQVANALQEYAEEQKMDVGPKEISGIVREGSFKKELVPRGRTLEYLAGKAGAVIERGGSNAEALKTVRFVNDEHCEEVLPDEALRALVDDVERGDKGRERRITRTMLGQAVGHRM